MKHSLPRLIVLVCGAFSGQAEPTWGQTIVAGGPVGGGTIVDTPTTPSAASHPTTQPATPSATPLPAQLLDQAINVLARRRSIVAKVRYRAQMLDRQLIGTGELAQGPGSSRLVRYDLRMQAGRQVVGRLQVSDGRYLWIVSHIKHEPELERVDVDRVVAAAGQGGATDANTDLALGGVSRLLVALRKDFEFTAAFRSQLGDVPIYGLEGVWRKQALERILAGHGAVSGAKSTDELRPHLPDRVVLYLGADDLFPYRIEYRRSVSGTAQAGASSAADDSRPLLILEFYEVRFDALLEETLFTFSPGTRPFVDVTDSYIAKQSAIP